MYFRMSLLVYFKLKLNRSIRFVILESVNSACKSFKIGINRRIDTFFAKISKRNDSLKR